VTTYMGKLRPNTQIHPSYYISIGASGVGRLRDAKVLTIHLINSLSIRLDSGQVSLTN
jgi:hypothetical protein